jgi:hypothetical protein
MVIGVLALRGVDRDAGVGPAAPVVVAGRQLMQRAEAFDFGGVCGDDPPVGCPGVLPAGGSAAFEPSEQGRRWQADREACRLGRVQEPLVIGHERGQPGRECKAVPR